MKKLYHRLAVTFAISMLLILAFFIFSLYERSKWENYNYLSQLLTSIESNLTHASEDYEDKIALLKEDYLNRALAVEYILSNDDQIISSAQLQVLKGIMEVKAIHVIGDSGKVDISTEYEEEIYYEKPEELEKILNDHRGYEIVMDTPDFSEIPSSFYIIARSNSDRYRAVRIDADVSKLQFRSRKELIETTLKQATTEYNTSIIAVGKESGEILGITENNRQQIEIDGIQTTQELLDFLEAAREKKQILVKINGKYQTAVVNSQEKMYLIAFSALDKLYENMTWTFWEGMVGIGTICIVTIMVLHYYLKKYLFAHFEDVKDNIRRILEGNHDTKLREIQQSRIPELKPLVETILELEKEYINKTEGINRIEDQLSLAQSEAKFDKLTGLYNRRGFEQCVEEFLKEDHAAGVLVLFDLDNFKKVNDMEGHPEGDRILERFAECLNMGFRKDDFIGRLGGDEFIVLMPNAVSQESLKKKFQSILKNVKTMLGSYYEKYKVSVSIGAVPIDGTIKSYGGLYRCADTALYIAKYLGKDQYYINDKKISCMKRKCIGCRKDCPRSKLLHLKEKKEE